MPSLGNWAPMHEYSHPSNIHTKHVQALCQGFPCIRPVPGSLRQHSVVHVGWGDRGDVIKRAQPSGKLRLVFRVNEERVVGAAVNCRELHGDLSSSLPSCAAVVRGAGAIWGRRERGAAL